MRGFTSFLILPVLALVFLFVYFSFVNPRALIEFALVVGKAFLKFSSFSTALTKPVAPCLRYLRGIGLLRCHRIGGALKGCRRGSMSAFVGKADIGSLTPTSKSVRVPAELASSQRLQGWLHAPARFHQSYCWLSSRLA